MEFVDNTTLRHAVGLFAAKPEQRTALDVLRCCMCGELLSDTTGSDVFATGEQPFRQGSELRIRTGTGPDGGRALFAFTRQTEIEPRATPGSTCGPSIAVSAAELLG